MGLKLFVTEHFRTPPAAGAEDHHGLLGSHVDAFGAVGHLARLSGKNGELAMWIYSRYWLFMAFWRGYFFFHILQNMMRVLLNVPDEWICEDDSRLLESPSYRLYFWSTSTQSKSCCTCWNQSRKLQESWSGLEVGSRARITRESRWILATHWPNSF